MKKHRVQRLDYQSMDVGAEYYALHLKTLKNSMMLTDRCTRFLGLL